MPRTTPVTTNFTAGELSPRLRARVNWEKYPNGVSELTNFLIQPHGPVAKRPGSQFIAEVKDSSKQTRITPFQFSVTQTYVLEWGDYYVRFYSERGQVYDGAVPLEVATVYPATAVDRIRYLQSADVLFLFHPDYQPYKLSRLSHTSWVFDPVVFRNGPWMSMNDTDITLTPSDEVGTITLTASSSLGTELIDNGSFAAEPTGVDLVAEGDFATVASWTYGFSWIHGSNCMYHIPDTDLTPLEQAVVVVPATSYIVTYTILSTNGETLYVSLGSTQGTPRTEIGTYTEVITTTDAAGLKFVAHMNLECSITNVSIYEADTTEPYWTWGTGWSLDVANGGALHTAGDTAELEQTTTAADGDYVCVRYTVSGRTAGNVTAFIGSALVAVTSTNEVVVRNTTASGLVNALHFLPTTDFDGRIDDISVKVLSSPGIFNDNHVGAYFKLFHSNMRAIYEITCSNPAMVHAMNDHDLQTGDRITLMGMHTFGNWPSLNGLDFEVTVINTNWFSIPFDTSAFSGSPYLPGLGGFIKTDGGYVKITNVIDAFHATGTVESSLTNTDPTTDWAESAWNDYRGYPAVAALHDERLICASTYSQPQTIWGSVVGDYTNHQMGSDDDDAWSYTIASGELETIRWLVTLEILLLGTASKCFRLSSTNLDDPITPTNFQIKPNVAYGAANLHALITGEAVLYLDRQRRRVRELAYNFEKGNTGGYVSQDMTLLAEHITKPGVSNMALSQNPDQVVWCVRDDGILVAMTYERAQQVTGWHKHETDGDVEWVAVIPGDVADELWLVVKRTINGATRRYVEMIDLDETPDAEEDCFFVDSGLSYDGVPADVMSGLDHLEGKIVQVLADGTIHPERTVRSGQITLDGEYSKVHVGLGYECRLKTLPIEAGAAEGSAQGKIKRYHQVAMMLEKSMGLYIQDDGSVNVEPVDDSWVPQTIVAPYPGGFDIYGRILFTQNVPGPCIIQGIAPRIITADA